MIKRSFEKAFMCKSHVMIMIHSEWCLLFFTCFSMGRSSHLFFGGRRGVSKRKTKSYTRKEGEKIGTQGSMGKRLCKSHLFLAFGNVRKEVLIFLILFEWKVLNRHNFDLPGINQYCSHCRISVIDLQWKDFQDKPCINSIDLFGSLSVVPNSNLPRLKFFVFCINYCICIIMWHSHLNDIEIPKTKRFIPKGFELGTTLS